MALPQGLVRDEARVSFRLLSRSRFAPPVLVVVEVFEAPDADGGRGERRRLEGAGERGGDDEERGGVDGVAQLALPAQAAFFCWGVARREGQGEGGKR